MQRPNEIISNSFSAKFYSCFREAHITCFPTDGLASVSSSVPTLQSSGHTSFASPPVANENPPESYAPMEEDTFPNCSDDSTLPSFSQVPETVNSSDYSFNTAVFSTSHLDDQFSAQQTIVPPSPSGFPIKTSTPTKSVMQRPLLTDALLTNASSRMATLSTIRRSDRFCPNPLRSNTVNQKHGTAQHNLKKHLSQKLKNE